MSRYTDNNGATRGIVGLALLLVLSGTLASVHGHTPLAFLASEEGTQEVRWLYWQQVRDGR